MFPVSAQSSGLRKVLPRYRQEPAGVLRRHSGHGRLQLPLMRARRPRCPALCGTRQAEIRFAPRRKESSRQQTARARQAARGGGRIYQTPGRSRADRNCRKQTIAQAKD